MYLTELASLSSFSSCPVDLVLLHLPGHGPAVACCIVLQLLQLVMEALALPLYHLLVSDSDVSGHLRREDVDQERGGAKGKHIVQCPNKLVGLDVRCY